MLIIVIFGSFYQKFEEIVHNIKKTGKSDAIISFGNNSYVSRIFLEDIINKEIEDNCIFINFNAYIHSTEDFIFKKLCQKLGIRDNKNGFAGSQKALEDYFKNENDKFVIIVFENIEHLFAKKKQVLFYTFLELLNVSNNVLFCGTTFNFNLMDMMEKRIRSRFSQKTMFISIKEKDDFFAALENILVQFNTLYKVIEKPFNFSPLLDSLIGCATFVIVMNKYIEMGVGIKEIITKLRYILTLVVLELDKRKGLAATVEDVLVEYEKEEKTDSYLNLLKSKIYLI
jgi:hypothetical protein